MRAAPGPGQGGAGRAGRTAGAGRRHGRGARGRAVGQTPRPRQRDCHAEAALRPEPSRAHRRGAGRRAWPPAAPERQRGRVPHAVGRGMRALLGQRRAARQGRRLRHPGPRRGVRPPPAWAATRGSWACRCTRRRNCSTPPACRAGNIGRHRRARRWRGAAASARDPCQRHAARNPRRAGRERQRPGAVRRARRPPRAGRQSIQGPGVARAAGHAGGLRRHRPRAHRVSARRRHRARRRGGSRRRRPGARGHRQPGAAGPGPAGAGAEGSARHQGRAAVHGDLAPVAVSGVPALRPRRRGVGAHRRSADPRAAAQLRARPGREHRAAHRRGRGERRRLHRAHRRAPGAARSAARRHAVPLAPVGTRAPGAVARVQRRAGARRAAARRAHAAR